MPFPSAPAPSQFPKTRALIWVYFWLLIFEGALRKWILPGLSNPLLIVRDPVAIAIYFMAAQEKGFPKTAYIPFTAGLAVFSALVSMLVIPLHPVITGYGVRSNFLHLPLVFVCARVLTLEDVRRIGYYTLWLAPFMALLVYRQFTSPADSWVNTGAGLDSGQIESAYDKIRPAGTFSFSNGLLAFVSMVTAFVFHGFFRANTYPRKLLFAAVPSLFLMVALSGSRSVLSSVSLLFLAAVIISALRPALVSGSVKALVAAAVVYTAIGSWSVIRQGIEVLDYRYQGGGGLKEGLVDRYLDTLVPMNAIENAPFFGYGLGMGTNAAAGLLTGERGFLLAENEWERIIFESGQMFGLAYIALRIAITLQAGTHAFLQLRRGDTLAPFLFVGFGLQMLNGQFAQPAALGFGVFGIGLCMAATVAVPRVRTPGSVAAPGRKPLVPSRGRFTGPQSNVTVLPS